MSFTPNFTASQNSGTPAIITLTDTSTGSDVAISSRQVFLLNATGTYTVPSGTSTNYIVWPYASSTIDLNVLTQDTALTITVNWLDSGGTILYTKTLSFGFQAFGENFYYGLTQSQVPISNPNIAMSQNYYQNKMIFRVLLDSAAQAITYASDIYSAQTAYDSDQYMIDNQNFFF